MESGRYVLGNTKTLYTNQCTFYLYNLINATGNQWQVRFTPGINQPTLPVLVGTWAADVKLSTVGTVIIIDWFHTDPGVDTCIGDLKLDSQIASKVSWTVAFGQIGSQYVGKVRDARCTLPHRKVREVKFTGTVMMSEV